MAMAEGALPGLVLPSHLPEALALGFIGDVSHIPRGEQPLAILLPVLAARDESSASTTLAGKAPAVPLASGSGQ